MGGVSHGPDRLLAHQNALSWIPQTSCPVAKRGRPWRNPKGSPQAHGHHGNPRDLPEGKPLQTEFQGIYCSI